MKLHANYIPTGPSKSFDEIVADIKNQSQTKTASVQAEVKTASEHEGESSGQLDVEPLHQKGESEHPDPVDMSKKKEASDGSVENTDEEDKEVLEETDSSEEEEDNVKKAESSCCDTDNENTGDADSSGQPEWEGKQENVNDPEKDDDKEGEEKIADGKPEKKIAFKKICNLDEKGKALLREFWLTQYSPEYVDAMLADK